MSNEKLTWEYLYDDWWWGIGHVKVYRRSDGVREIHICLDDLL